MSNRLLNVLRLGVLSVCLSVGGCGASPPLESDPQAIIASTVSDLKLLRNDLVDIEKVVLNPRTKESLTSAIRIMDITIPLMETGGDPARYFEFILELTGEALTTDPDLTTKRAVALIAIRAGVRRIARDFQNVPKGNPAGVL